MARWTSRCGQVDLNHPRVPRVPKSPKKKTKAKGPGALGQNFSRARARADVSSSLIVPYHPLFDFIRFYSAALPRCPRDSQHTLQFDEWSRKDLDEYQTGRASLSSFFVVCLERLNTCWVCLNSIIYIYIFIRSFVHSFMYEFIHIHSCVNSFSCLFLSFFLSFFLLSFAPRRVPPAPRLDANCAGQGCF